MGLPLVNTAGTTDKTSSTTGTSKCGTMQADAKVDSCVDSGCAHGPCTTRITCQVSKFENSGSKCNIRKYEHLLYI